MITRKFVCECCGEPSERKLYVNGSVLGVKFNAKMICKWCAKSKGRTRTDKPVSGVREFVCTQCGQLSTRRLSVYKGKTAEKLNAITICESCRRHDAITKIWAETTNREPSSGITKYYDIDGYRVQGLYEALYLKWLLRNKIRFICHPLPGIKVNVDGEQKTYLPDFYLVDTEEYIDVKPKKNLSLRGSNRRKIELAILAGHRIRITTSEDEWFNRDTYKQLRLELNATTFTK